jgi:hypothetical protein
MSRIYNPLATDTQPEPDNAPSVLLRALDGDAGQAPPPEANGESNPSAGFTVWTPKQLLEWVSPPNQDILAGGFIHAGELAVLAGQPGLGKSRLILFLAICQITGQPWLGLPTCQPPRRWLLIGNENSTKRLQGDLKKMMAGLDDAQRELVNENLFFHILETPEDSMLTLDNPETKGRLTTTLNDIKPNVAVFDPWGALTPDEDKGAETRAAIYALLGIAKRCGDPAVLVAAHARVGAGNISMGTGWNKGAFIKGSKVLLGCARSVFNLMPGAADDETKLVLACGKSNNAASFSDRGVLFDPQTFTYGVDPSFDVQAWQSDLDGTRKGQSVTIKDVCNVIAGGHNARKDIVAMLVESKDVDDRTVDRRIRDAVKAGFIERSIPPGTFNLTPKWKK